MGVITRGNSVIINSIRMECTVGQMGELIRETGWMERCMAMAFSNGQMETITREGMSMGRSKDKGSFFGEMVEFMMESGKTV